MFKTTNRSAVTIAACALLLGATSAHAIEAGKTVAAQAPVLAAQDDGERRGGGGFFGNIFGCQASGSKQEIGAAVGGVAGGLLGNRIAGRNSRTLGTVLGGVLGAAGGSILGCKLQKNDRAKAERALENAVATNQSQSWENPETGASGRVEVGQVASGAALSDIKFANGVEPAGGYDRVNGAFVSTTSANIRSAPTTDAKIIGKLASGQNVWVPASVSGSPWMLISSGGVGQGYVSSALLKRAAINTAAGCKSIRQTVSTANGTTESENLQACKDKNGQWVMTRV
jgi:uncharacterized protein YgiM (DUF1202 family)